MKKVALSLLVCSLSVFAANANKAQVPNVPDAPTKYPEGKVGEYVKLGEDIINNTNTHPLSKNMVGNPLTCTNCHINGGKAKTIGTFIGTAAAFPAYSKREGTLQTLEDRINNCFMRSLNGVRPENGTELSLAMAAYVTWLSDGLPSKMNTKKTVNAYYTDLWPEKKVVPKIKAATHKTYLNGKALYEQKCAACHQKNGAGIPSAFPALWGKNSYNAGAGMSKLDKMATWVAYNMPQYQEGTLTWDEAVDITIYVNAQERPSFDVQDHLQQGVHYNSKITNDKSDVAKNFKAFGLDLKSIRGE